MIKKNTYLVALLILLGCQSEDSQNDKELCALHYRAESYKVAEKFCLSAAEAGDLNAQWILSNILRNGLANDKNDELAFKWLTAAAENAHSAAQRELGKSYLWGQGVEVNNELAMKWLKLAARKNDANAEFYIGVIYLGANDQVPDHNSALNWFQKAAGKGHKMAMNNMAWLFSTSPNKSIRNGKLAVKIMEGLIQTSPHSPIFLDTLAAAYAEANEFEKAIAYQKQAIAVISKNLSEEEKNGYLERLSTFESKKPWRDQIKER